jgi:hypothetical protein
MYFHRKTESSETARQGVIKLEISFHFDSIEGKKEWTAEECHFSSPFQEAVA